MARPHVEPGEETINARQTLGFGLGPLEGLACRDILVRERPQQSHHLTLTLDRVDHHKKEIERAPALRELGIGDVEVRAVVVAILDDELALGVIVAGDELVVAHPADLAGVIALIIALLRHHRVSGSQHAPEQINVASITEGSGHAGDIFVDEILQLIGHDIPVFVARLDGLADHVTVSLPTPEIERH